MQRNVDALVAIRNGTAVVDLTQLKGIISFPSFHAVMAVLLTRIHRGSRLLWPMAALNAVMLLSVLSEGGHYLVDAIAGAAIAGIAILATARLGRLRPAVAAAAI